MIRAVGRSGKRRKYDGGFTESPAPCQPVGVLDEPDDLLLTALQCLLHLRTGDHGEPAR